MLYYDWVETAQIDIMYCMFLPLLHMRKPNLLNQVQQLCVRGWKSAEKKKAEQILFLKCKKRLCIIF